MSFWNDPGASFQGLMDDPWHSLENFGTTGLVPLIPYVAGAYLGPAGGAAAQGGIDYFSGNSEARTGKGMFGSLLSGAGKGYAGASAGNFIGGGGLDSLGSYFGGGGESSYGMLDSVGGDGGSFSGDLFKLDGSGQGSIGSGGMNSLLSNLGLGSNSGSFAGQEAFQLPMQSYTPDYLNSLANYNGVDAGNPSFLDNLLGNNEQGLYNQEGLAQKASGQTLSDQLKKKTQQNALDQLTKSGSKMQEQNNAQQTEQNRMAQLQAMMRKGQNVDVVSSLLALLQDREQQSKQPRISLI
jgi:hypothetical protein